LRGCRDTSGKGDGFQRVVDLACISFAKAPLQERIASLHRPSIENFAVWFWLTISRVCGAPRALRMSVRRL
jgi:hypothetical protein